MRIFLGFLVAAVALTAAAYLHTGIKAGTQSFTSVTSRDSNSGSPYFGNGSVYLPDSNDLTSVTTTDARAWWQDPLAVLIAVAGVGAGVAIALPAIRGR